MRFNFFVFIFLLLNSFSLSASHIIGGEMTYTCLGGGDYDVELFLYQDCDGADPTPLDPRIRISIYECGSGIACSSLIQQDLNDQNFLVDLAFIEEIEPNNIECLVADNIQCVNRGVYRFRLSDFGISLDLSSDSYYIVYQRCCRNEGIVNLPGDTDELGTSFFTEITPLSQQLCNSSPVFDTFPDLLICQNFTIDYFHSATDQDGDSLVYYFDAPISGGGTIDDVANGALTCDGVQPSPPCPPNTFETINYLGPIYTNTNPLGSSTTDGINTSVSIDSMNGLIAGIPTMAGIFVISVVVEEYRDGQLLGSIRRDFQHQVVRCEREIDAIITDDRTTFCDEGSITFEHESTPAEFVEEVLWEFDLLDGTIATASTDEIQVDFPTFGDFVGKLFVNLDSENCSDSAMINISIFPETIADFDFVFDTCDASVPVSFINRSSTQSGGIDAFSWDFGDGNSSTEFMPMHLYTSAGAMDVILTATDENGCEATAMNVLNYFPVSEEFIPPLMGVDECSPAEVNFDNLEGVLTDDFSINWDFGDGNTSTELTPTHIYEIPGNFGVTLSVLSPSGCETETVFGNLVQVNPSPFADFSFFPDEITVANPTANFIDQSLNAASWDWDFNGLNQSIEQNPVFTFPDTGMQVISLVVTHQSGCTDTATAIIDIVPSIELFIPNAFTPNGDGLNDIFLPVGFLFGPLEYQFSIWNRWGEQVFSTMVFGEGWNGRTNNVGKAAPNGVYTYLIEFVDSRGENFTRKGFATLVR